MAAAPVAQKQRTTSARAAAPAATGKGPALRRPGQQGAQQGGDGRREVSS